jgi:hypothetical protein
VKGVFKLFTERENQQYAEVFNCEKAQDNHLAKENNGGRRMMGTSFAHHPRTEKQGVEIHRSFNAKATTVEQAPGLLLRRGLRS